MPIACRDVSLRHEPLAPASEIEEIFTRDPEDPDDSIDIDVENAVDVL